MTHGRKQTWYSSSLICWQNEHLQVILQNVHQLQNSRWIYDVSPTGLLKWIWAHASVFSDQSHMLYMSTLAVLVPCNKFLRAILNPLSNATVSRFLSFPLGDNSATWISPTRYYSDTKLKASSLFEETLDIHNFRCLEKHRWWINSLI